MKAIVYVGSVAVTGQHRGADRNDHFFDTTKHVYGRTVGEVADNLVKASIELYDEVSMFIDDNMEDGYRLENTNDFWYVNKSIPNMVEENDFDEDSGNFSGSSLNSLIGIVNSVAAAVFIAVEFGVNRINNTRQRNGIDKPHIDLSQFDRWHSPEATPEDIMKNRIPGEVIDAIRTEAREDGTLKIIRRDIKLLRSYHSSTRQRRVAAAERKRKREARKSKPSALKRLLGIA